MFTVLIAEKEHIDAIRHENKLFLEPFLDRKDLALCYWNPTGGKLEDAVPGLFDAVGRKKEWRAVVIHNGSFASDKLRNPYDVVDHSTLDSLIAPPQKPNEIDSMDEWETSWKDYYNTLTTEKERMYKQALQFPLQKLATWLCFRPEDCIHSEIHEQPDVQEWAMEKLGRDDMKASVKLELLEREQYKRELLLKENLRRAFLEDRYLNISYPSEVHCISARAAKHNYFDPNDYWNVRQDSQYSTFADRNLYFDRMRFMVFDMLPPTHRDFRSDYIRFLSTVLIFVTNPIPGSAMQPRRLYQLEAETDDDPLCTLVTSYDRKLLNTYHVIESEMDKIKSEIPEELTDKDADALFCTSKDVAVLLDDSCEPDKMYAEKDYGLFFDSPENEFHKWNRDYNISKKALAYIIRQKTRSVRKGVKQMHVSSHVTDVNINRLTPLQVDDIRDYTDTAEDAMIASIPVHLSDSTAYTERMAAANEEVKTIIRRRMTCKTALVLGAVCLGLFLICYLPFLLSNNGTIQTVSTAIMLIGASLGLLTVILLISLFCMRHTVVKAIKGYNNTAHEVINDIHASLRQFSKYLSAVCNVRRGHEVQNYVQGNVDVYTKSLRVRKKHQEDIRKKRAQLEENYHDYLGNYANCDETMSRPYEYDFDQPTEYPYPAPFLAGDSRQIEFISNGNYITVPSSFVTRIVVRMEGIYDK